MQSYYFINQFLQHHTKNFQPYININYNNVFENNKMYEFNVSHLYLIESEKKINETIQHSTGILILEEKFLTLLEYVFN